MAAEQGAVPCRCDGDSSQKLAVSYCSDCDEFFCQDCTDYHEKISAFSMHRIRTDLNLCGNSGEPGSLTCEIHKKELLDFYCGVHDVVACGKCKETLHRDCADVHQLSSTPKNSEISSEYKKAVKSYEELIHSFVKTKESYTDKLNQLENKKADLLIAVREFRDLINKKLDERQKEIEMELHIFFEKERETLSAHLQDCETVLPSLYKSRDMLNALDKGVKDGGTFVNLKKSIRQLERYESMLETTTNYASTTYEFQGDRQLLGSLSSIGKLSKGPNSGPREHIGHSRSSSASSITSGVSRTSQHTSNSSMNIKYRVRTDSATISAKGGDTESSSGTPPDSESENWTQQTCIEKKPVTVPSSVSLKSLEVSVHDSKEESDKVDTHRPINDTRKLFDVPVSLHETSTSQSVKATESTSSPPPSPTRIPNQKGMIQEGRRNIKLKEDVHRCLITGAAFSENGNLLLVDSANKTLKMLGNNYKVQRVLELSSSPSDVTCISQKLVAVLLPSKKAVQLVTIAKQLSLDRRIPVQARSRRLTFAGGNLIVALNAELHVLDLSGSLLQQIRNSGKERLFHDIQSVAGTREGDRIFVSDSAKGVIGLASTGEVIFVYRNIYLPRGLCRGPEGYVYCCGYMSVFMITEDGYDVQSVLTRKSDGCVRPTVVAYSDTRRVLVHAAMGMDDTDNSISVYKITEEK